MRKVLAFEMITLDGYFEGPNGGIDWHNVDVEFNQFALEQIATVETLVFGRKTYEGMASYWPTPMALEDDPVVAERMNTLPKIVFSRTLAQANWHNTTLLGEVQAETIQQLKQQPGKDLIIFGSAKLVASFARLGLLGEYRLMVNPVVLGDGRTFFEDLSAPLKLDLVYTRAFRSGNVLLTYRPQTSPRDEPGA